MSVSGGERLFPVPAYAAEFKKAKQFTVLCELSLDL
jgi:hypothetical protein